MKQVPFAIVGALAILACAMPAAAQAPATEAPPAEAPKAMTPPPVMSDEATIVCDGKVKADGKVEFVFTPAGGTASTIPVTFQKGMGKQEGCRDIAKELSVHLGEKYEVRQYDDDKIKVEGKDKAQFALTLGASTVGGFTVRFK
jgi:hypothetical protein